MFGLPLTDMIMPGGMNGRQLRFGSPAAPVRVLLNSGYTDDAIIHHGRLDHGELLLPKPIAESVIVRRTSWPVSESVAAQWVRSEYT